MQQLISMIKKSNLLGNEELEISIAIFCNSKDHDLINCRLKWVCIPRKIIISVIKTVIVKGGNM